MTQDSKQNRDRIIETDGLTKRFGLVTAVEEVSLHVRRGEIYGFLGLNGAGKTTTIRMLLGLIRPTCGEARLFGEPIRSGGRGPWNQIGSLVETPHAYPELTVRENLDIIRRIRRLKKDSVEEAMESMNLSALAGRRSGHLSLGNKQRLDLAKALLHSPELLILDEPANGLDPAGIIGIRNLLLRLAHEEKVTVFVSSHILDEVSRIADRIGIIHEGRLLRESSAQELLELRKRRLLVSTRNNGHAREILRREGYPSAEIREAMIVLSEEKALQSPEGISLSLVRAGLPAITLKEEEENLESVFLRIIGKKEETDA